jgi:hypothetical protein
MEPRAEEVATIAAYMRRAAEALARESDASLMDGRAVFAPVMEGLAS